MSISSKKPDNLLMGTDKPARLNAACSSSLSKRPSLSRSMERKSMRSCLSAASTKTRNSLILSCHAHKVSDEPTFVLNLAIAVLIDQADECPEHLVGVLHGCRPNQQLYSEYTIQAYGGQFGEAPFVGP